MINDKQPRLAEAKNKTIPSSNLTGLHKELVDCIEQFNKGEIGADTTFKIQRQILTDEIEDAEFLEFAIMNISEIMAYIAQGKSNIRIHRDITGKM